MLREAFGGRNPSHFIKVDPIVRAYIISECFLWSGWNFVIPIFAVFATTQVPGGTIQIAASSYSTYLITRVIFELLSGNYLLIKSERIKIISSILGILIVSFAYLGFAFTNSVAHLFIFYALVGVGLGIATPAKNSLFSVHLDKNKEASEWSIADATSFISMALAVSLGGFIAGVYGFKTLFLIAGGVNLLAIPPYLLYLKRRPRI